MRIVRETISVAVSLAAVFALTALLWYIKITGNGFHHPVFFYLLPIALIALLYGSRPALVCAVAAAACAAFFLYDPVYSFHVSNRLELGDLICFAMLAAIGVKCAAELLRPVAKLPATRSRYGRP